MQEVIKTTNFDTLLTTLTGLKNLDIQLKNQSTN